VPAYAFTCVGCEAERDVVLDHSHTVADYPLCTLCGRTMAKNYRTVQVGVYDTPVGRNPNARPEGRRNAYEQSTWTMPGVGGEQLPVISPRTGAPMTIKERQNLGSTRVKEAVAAMRGGVAG
jgi:hypothetical protein